MRSHSFRDRFVLWLKPAFCLWTAAASASSLKARFIARPHRNGFAVRSITRGAARGGVQTAGGTSPAQTRNRRDARYRRAREAGGHDGLALMWTGETEVKQAVKE